MYRYNIREVETNGYILYRVQVFNEKGILVYHTKDTQDKEKTIAKLNYITKKHNKLNKYITKDFHDNNIYNYEYQFKKCIIKEEYGYFWVELINHKQENIMYKYKNLKDSQERVEKYLNTNINKPRDIKQKGKGNMNKKIRIETDNGQNIIINEKDYDNEVKDLEQHGIIIIKSEYIEDKGKE